jgi:hypothetical protein
MSWDQILSRMGAILGFGALRDDVVEAAYLAMRLISHRSVFAGGTLSPGEFLARDIHSSPSSRRLALAVVEEIVSSESAPLYEIPRTTLDVYTRALSEIVRRRLKQDLGYDEARGQMLLEALRRAG